MRSNNGVERPRLAVADLVGRRAAHAANMAEMDRDHILNEIRRTAKENGGTPLGQARFHQQTGIKQADWFGRYWARWGDALQEAGFSPNTLQGAYAEELLLERFVQLIREIGRFPGPGDLRLKRHADSTFRSHNTFGRFGAKRRFVARILEYCRSVGGFEDVVSLLGAHAALPADSTRESAENTGKAFDIGFVYLLKSGRYFKIGKTNAHGRRERELAIQLPEKARSVHVIKTDDPAGIEVYWHRGSLRREGTASGSNSIQPISMPSKGEVHVMLSNGVMESTDARDLGCPQGYEEG